MAKHVFKKQSYNRYTPIELVDETTGEVTFAVNKTTIIEQPIENGFERITFTPGEEPKHDSFQTEQRLN